MALSKSFYLTFFLACTFNLFAQKTTTTAEKEVELAETRMFQNMNFTHAKEYYKTDVADDFFTINDDGVTADKKQSLADTLRLKMIEMCELKILDRKIRIYGNVGITNGRAQAYMNGTMVVEFLYTTVFVKRNGKWMYTSWQGTISKNSAPPPPPPAK